MNRSITRIIAITIFLTHCPSIHAPQSTQAENQPAPQAEHAAPKEEITSQGLHRFMIANFNQFANKPHQAQHWYKQLVGNKTHKGIYLGYIPYLQAIGNHKEIVNLIPEIDSAFKDNLELQMAIAHALEKTGSIQAAQERLVRLCDKNKANQELAFKVAQLYMERKEPENALTIINNLLNNSPRKPNNFIFHFLKSQILMQLDKKEDALASIKTCIETYPRFDKGWLLYAAILEQAGKIEEAMKGYTTFLETTSEKHAEIEQHLLQLAFKQKLSQHHPEHMAANKQCITQAMALFEKKQYRKALANLDVCLQSKPDSQKANLAKIEILTSEKKYDEATEHIKKLILEQKDPDYWLETLHLMTLSGLPHEKAIATLSAIEKKQPRVLMPVLYKADLYLRTNDQANALKTLKKALTLNPTPEIKAKVLYQIAVIQYETQKFPDMKKTLDEAIALNIDYPPTLNLLAYYYATKGKDLAQAEQYVTKALAKDAHNPHFLDTKALILYKQQKYQDALPLLEASAQQCPHDFTVAKHLGKTHYKLGNKEHAVTAMKSAQQLAQTPQQKLKAEHTLNRWNGSKS